MWPQDYYEFLGVRRDASAEEIRAAYRELARHFPIGIDLGVSQTEQWLQTLCAAYQTLSDPQRRAEYDAAHPQPAPAERDSPEDVKRRLAALEAELARVRRQRDEYRRIAYDALADGPVDLSEDWLKEPAGTSVEAILAEYEQRQEA